MVRKLASAVALIAMAVSATALALGLGDLQTRSALNQAFEAEVELLSVDPTELDGLRVRLASSEAFQRAGVDRPFFLSGLKFTPQLSATGKTIVRVHSDKPIREPFLNFLMEVQWPKGKMVREYTVLLDPPTTLARRPARVDRSQSTSLAPSSPRASTPASAATSQAVMPNEYGPVKDSETLWGISRKLRPDGASLAQTMMALYKANPDAFAQGDINRLQKGRILRVPGRDEFFALSRGEADAAYRAEQESALASRTQAPAASAEVATDDAATATSDTDVAGSGGTAAPTADSELRIATPRPEGAGVAGSGDDAATEAASAEDLKNALLLARENAETSRQATDNLRTEVSALEQQLADMQRLLSLKDDQLARMQATVQEDDASLPGTAATTDAGMAPEMTDAAPATEGVDGEVAVAGVDAETASPADAAAVADGAEVATADTDATVVPTEDAAAEPAETMTSDLASESQPAAEPQVVAEPEVADEPVDTPPEQGLFERLMGNTGLLAGIAAVILALLVGLLLLLRRRKSSDDDDDLVDGDDLDESILLQPSDGDDFDLDPEEAAPSGNDTSFLSEFSPSEMHSLADETSEVDPVSEADVYIAYGRYDQAEELLGQALSREPGRMALKFKLLEVYYANRNVAAFTACAQELADAGQDGVDTGAWQRVCDMGRDLSPDYPLFATGAADVMPDSLPNFEPSQPVDLDPLSAFGEESILDIPGPDTDKSHHHQSVDAHSEHAGEADLDMTLDLDDLSMSHSIAQDDETIDGLESIELELPDLDMDPAKKTVTSDASDDSLLFELDTGLEDSVADSRPASSADEGLDAESLQAQLEELSDLTDLDDELSQLTADFEDLPAASSKVKSESPATPSNDDMDLDIPSPFANEMVDEDEVQTKLDLAIAYVEMGDKEGARSILDEVCAEGNDNQKAEAEKLLTDINV